MADQQSSQVTDKKKSPFAINPLLPKTPEQNKRIAKELAEIQQTHRKTQNHVRKYFMNDPQPIRIDKA